MGSQRYILYKCLQNLLPIYPVYTLLFEDAGLDIHQISMLLAIWSIPVVLLEIPSGVLADRWNRRNLLVVAALLKASCFLAWMVHTFTMFAVGFVCWGIAEALSSGAEEALVFDSLKMKGKQDMFARVYGSASAAVGGAVALSCFGGGFLAQLLGFDLVLILSITATLGTALIVFGSDEVNLYRKKPSLARRGTTVPAIRFIIHRREMLYVALLYVVPLSMAGILDEYDPLIAFSFGLPLSLVGIWVGIRYLLESVGAFLSKYFNGSAFRTPCILGLVAGGVLCAHVLIRHRLSLVFYFMFYLILSIAHVLQENLMQQKIEEQGRSTVHSVVNLATDFHAILLFSILGIFSNPSHLVLFISLYTLVASLLISPIFKRK